MSYFLLTAVEFGAIYRLKKNGVKNLNSICQSSFCVFVSVLFCTAQNECHMQSLVFQTSEFLLSENLLI